MKALILPLGLLLMPVGVAAQDATAPPVALAPQVPAAAAATPTAPSGAGDPIGALLQSQQTADVEPGQGEVKAPEPAPVVSETTTPVAPLPYAAAVAASPPAAQPVRDRPVMIHETGVSPDGPPDISQLTYESRVRGSVAAAQGLQGPLDGTWRLTDAAGEPLYTFQLVDPGRGGGELEGAWRDLRRGEGLGGVGVVSGLERSADGVLTMRFQPRRGGKTMMVALTPRSDGGWTGGLSDGGQTRPVILVREVLQAVGYTTVGQISPNYAPRPYDSTPRYVPAKPTAKAKKPVRKKATTKRSKSKKRR